MQRRHNLNPALRHNRALDAKTTISRIGGQMTQETVTNGTEALFTREGMPPVKEMIPCALQHVLASFAGIITPAVIMAGVYGFNSQQSTDIIQVALILSAIDTALQAFAPFRRIGGGLPIVMGVSFAFLPALQAMGASGFSFGALLGGEIVGGAVAVLFGLAYSKIKWLFPPVVTGTVIFSIGVSLYPTAVKYMAGGMGTPLWGTPQAWCVALITFAVVFALANFGKGTLKLGSVFFGMIVGMIVSIPFGMIDFSSVATAQVFALPKLMPYALEFDPEVCITLAVVFPMVAIQVIGDVSAACLGSIDRMPTERELSGAIVSQGLTSMVGGLLGGDVGHVVGGIDHESHAVNGEGECFQAEFFNFLVLQRAARVADLDEPFAHLLYAHAGTAARHGDADIGIGGHDAFGGFLHDRDMGGASGDIQSAFHAFKGIKGGGHGGGGQKERCGESGEQELFHRVLTRYE